jgi:hypothetical protein
LGRTYCYVRLGYQQKESNGKDINKGKHEAGAVPMEPPSEDVERRKIVHGNGKGTGLPLQFRWRRPNEIDSCQVQCGHDHGCENRRKDCPIQTPFEAPYGNVSKPKATATKQGKKPTTKAKGQKPKVTAKKLAKVVPLTPSPDKTTPPDRSLTIVHLALALR